MIIQVFESSLILSLDALAAYERKQKDDPTQPEYMLGRMRALHAMGEWERLFDLSKVIKATQLYDWWGLIFYNQGHMENKPREHKTCCCSTSSCSSLEHG